MKIIKVQSVPKKNSPCHNDTPFHPHVSMENKLEEQHKKGKRKNLPTEKTPKRTYRSPGNVSGLVDAPLRRRDLLPRHTRMLRA